jgi:hypothetical protein
MGILSQEFYKNNSSNFHACTFGHWLQEATCIVYPIVVFLNGCYNEKKNVLVVFACLVVVLMKHLK